MGLEIDAVRAWPNAALIAVTTIKSTDSLEVESVRAGGVGTSLDGVEVRSVAAGSCLCNESPTLTAYLSWTSPWERGRPARILIPANSLPSTATPLQSAPNPPLRGSLPSCQVLCGRDARAPGWVLFLQAACHPRPLPCKAHQTRLYGVLFHVTHYRPEMCLIANIAVEIVSHPEGSSPT